MENNKIMYYSMGAPTKTALAAKLEASAIRDKFAAYGCYRDVPPLFLGEQNIFFACPGQDVKCSAEPDMIDFVKKNGTPL